MSSNAGTLTTGRTGRAPTLGLLVDRFESEYAGAILGGVTQAIRESGASLVCLVGGPLNTPDGSNRERNSVYELGKSAEPDGLIVLGGTLATSGAWVAWRPSASASRAVPSSASPPSCRA